MYSTAKSNPKSQKEMRKRLRNQLTPEEALLWNVLKNRQVSGLKFRRQHGMGAYVMDFYCPSIKLCIELDGEAHRSEDANDYDDKRTLFFKENGITVMRFENCIVRNDMQAIINAIVAFCEERSNLISQTTPDPSFGKGGEG